MTTNARYLSLLLVLSLLLPGQQANITSHSPLKVLDNQVFFSRGPTEEEINQALTDVFPAWAIFEQPVSWKPEPAKVGEIIREASLFEETFALNPAVTLVTLGVSLDWQLPPDSDLYSRAIATGDRLHSLWFEWTDSENETLRANHSNIANAATYALYAFLGYDEEKLTLWRNAYSSLFGEDPSQPPKTVFFQQVQATSLTPFLARPFVHPAESFYTVNSFF